MKYLDVADIVRNSDKDSVVLTVHREGRRCHGNHSPCHRCGITSLFSMKCWILKSATSALQFTGVTGEQYQEALMTCKNREWRNDRGSPR